MRNRFLINGGVASISLIRNLLMTKGVLGIRENCGCRFKDMGATSNPTNKKST